MEKLVAISELFEISLDALVMENASTHARADSARSEIPNEQKKNLLTDENKQIAKRGLKILAIGFGIILLVDVISMIVYFSLYGFPQ